MLLVLGTAQMLGGCLIIQNRGTTQGSLSFGWTLGGAACTPAGVSQIQVTVTPRAAGGSAVAPFLVDCTLNRTTLSGLREGDYTLTLEGVDGQNVIQFDTSRTALVVAGGTTDLGTVDLLPLQGSLTVDWQFERPGVAPTPVCLTAGVGDVEVLLKDNFGTTVFDELIPCDNGPSDIINLTPGSYSAEMTGWGTYNNLAVPLYGAVVNGIMVTREMPANLGAVTLAINAAQFGNLDVAWTLPNQHTCAQSGLGSAVFNVAISRNGSTDVEDMFTADCTAVSAVRMQFVPGDWKVVITGTDSQSRPWRGERVGNVAPGQTQRIAVPLAPI